MVQVVPGLFLLFDSYFFFFSTFLISCLRLCATLQTFLLFVSCGWRDGKGLHLVVGRIWNCEAFTICSFLVSESWVVIMNIVWLTYALIFSIRLFKYQFTFWHHLIDIISRQEYYVVLVLYTVSIGITTLYVDHDLVQIIMIWMYCGRCNFTKYRQTWWYYAQTCPYVK